MRSVRIRILRNNSGSGINTRNNTGGSVRVHLGSRGSLISLDSGGRAGLICSCFANSKEDATKCYDEYGKCYQRYYCKARFVVSGWWVLNAIRCSEICSRCARSVSSVTEIYRFPVSGDRLWRVISGDKPLFRVEDWWW